jgi:hypothetical protein
MVAGEKRRRPRRERQEREAAEQEAKTRANWHGPRWWEGERARMGPRALAIAAHDAAELCGSLIRPLADKVVNFERTACSKQT